MYDHNSTVAAFSKACDELSDNLGLFGLSPQPMSSPHVTPQSTAVRITDIDAWWWKTENYAGDYARDILSKTRDDAGHVITLLGATVDKVKNNSVLFGSFYSKFMRDDALMADASTQKTQYSEHVATYATDLMETTGFKGLKANVEQSGELTVMPAIIIDTNARDLESAFCVSVQVATRDQSPVRPVLNRPRTLVA
jgi:hypothetical protein